MKAFFKVLSSLIFISIVSAVAWVVFNSRTVLDYIALRDYTAPVAVSKIADDTTMNEDTRKVFYVNHPELQNKRDFKNSCTQQEETIVLGCYVENDGIYLFDVKDKRLDGIVEVTAGHEVLHALYDRLSDSERQSVDKMVMDFYKNDLKSERIKNNINNYRKRDPGVVANELHSILGTEVRDLTPELEEYYGQYFDDRLAIVSLSEAYESTFTKLEDQAEDYKNQIDNLRAKISENDGNISTMGDQLDAERQRLDQLLEQDKTEEYNSLVPSFNSMVNQYNDLIQQRKALVSEYNNYVSLYNKVASTEADLIESLSVDAEPVQGEALN